MIDGALIEISAARQALVRASDLATVLEIRDQAAAVHTYAIAKGAGEAANEAKEIQLRAERRAGEFLAAGPKNSGGRPTKTGCTMQPVFNPTYEKLGIEKTQAHRWQAIARLPEREFEAHIVQSKNDGRELTQAGMLRLAKKLHTMSVMGSSESSEWYTPAHIVRLTLELFDGTIDTDPCSNDKDAPNVPATFLYTEEDNGLEQIWHGAVYMNPPYGLEVPHWTKALVQKYKGGEIREAIALLPGRIDTQWFQPLFGYLICAIRGRLCFVGSPHSAPFPSVVVYLGNKRDRFIQIFGILGPILERVG